MARIRIRKLSDGAHVASIHMHTHPTEGVGDIAGDACITVSGVGADPIEAMSKASLLAERITNDPVLRAILPPQAIMAVQATKQLASAAKQGRRVFKSVWGRLRGKGKKRVAAALAPHVRNAPARPSAIQRAAAIVRDHREAAEDHDEETEDAHDDAHDEDMHDAAEDVQPEDNEQADGPAEEDVPDSEPSEDDAP